MNPSSGLGASRRGSRGAGGRSRLGRALCVSRSAAPAPASLYLPLLGVPGHVQASPSAGSHGGLAGRKAGVRDF